MRFAMFYHSLVSDWNHGNAHFLRGVVTELLQRGHTVRVYEPAGGWSLTNLLRDHGPKAVREFQRFFPHLQTRFYDPASIDLDRELEAVDVVLMHEWNDPQVVADVGRHRGERGGYLLLFHDTHHRSVTAPGEIRCDALDEYDGVLAFGEVIRQVYLDNDWARNAWTWHEAADTRVFHPGNGSPRPMRGEAGDLVWIGNWGDGERSEELGGYLVEPVRRLALRARVHGVRYPEGGLKTLSDAQIPFAGWLANHRVPEVFSRFSCTMHIPRRPYREVLPGIPTIRVFEAMACGIPLVCLRWEDSEGLFEAGEDYLLADTPEQMLECLNAVLTDEALARRLSASGPETIQARHTCAHRVDELLRIIEEIRPRSPSSLQLKGV